MSNWEENDQFPDFLSRPVAARTAEAFSKVLTQAMKAIDETTGKIIADNLVVAGTLLARMKGLLCRDSLSNGEGLLIKPCMGIHTFGMKYSLDIVFLNRGSRVVAVKRNMPPNRVSRIYLSAVSVLELPAGALEGMQVAIGDRIVIG